MIIETVSFIRLEEKRFIFMDVDLPRLPGIAIYMILGKQNSPAMSVTEV